MFKNQKISKFICSLDFHLKNSSAVSMPLYNRNADELGIYETIISKADIEKLKISRDTFILSDDFIPSRAGGYYQQRLSFKIKSSNRERSLDLEKLRLVKYITLNFSDGSKYVIGQNDINQNTYPSLEHSSNENFTEISFSSHSLFPLSSKVEVDSNYSFLYPFFYLYP